MSKFLYIFIIFRLEKLNELASKEYGLEKMLNQMKEEWIGMNFELTKWKNSNVI